MSNIYQIYNTEALTTLKEMADKSIDCIITDPPYFKYITHQKDNHNVDWDDKWSDKLEFLQWLELIVIEFKRVLKDNGSLYLFCSNKLNAHIQVMIEKHFKVLNNLVWDKGNNRAGRTCKEELRHFFDNSERCIFCEQYNSDKMEKGYKENCNDTKKSIYKPLIDYFIEEKGKAGVSKKEIDSYLNNQMYKHYFDYSQWHMPTEKNYIKLQELFNKNIDSIKYLNKDYEILNREYKELKKEYEKIQETFKSLRRPMNLNNTRPYTAVWKYGIVPSSKKNRHVCEKPLDMIEHIVLSSTNKNQIVLDAFCGSGVVGEACKKHWRGFTGIELDFEWACIADERIKNTLEI